MKSKSSQTAGKRLFRGAIYLFAGVVATYLTTLAIALAPLQAAWTTVRFRPETWPDWVPADWPSISELVAEPERRIHGNRAHWLWMVRAREEFTSGGGPQYHTRRVEAGAPFRALTGEIGFERASRDAPHHIVTPPGLRSAAGSFPLLAPVVPIWPGFALNVAFYSIAIGAAVRTVRRRSGNRPSAVSAP